MDGCDTRQSRRYVDGRRGESAATKRRRDEQRIANALERLGRVSPQLPPRDKVAHGTRMVLEIGCIRDDVALDAAAGMRRRLRSKPPQQRDTLDASVLVQIRERID